ncbi:Cystathionine gamma-synthase [Purpureocillium takamizusanense]|uniref:Cystathionine gamma-synthase n=1 Tax=Purpureocillium takamizusanense TaxID=2060973 RepID=A0A9Q8QHY7_9HYPO|nr:Cystathionine gamma-synthase [Purpureocillium takamizusanense]UNI20183.1 Cystathionine gamma-synthase [Purpureocillium takamizusanense]
MTTALGEAMPANDEHAISVSLPQWDHFVSIIRNDAKVLDTLKAGYPRFNIHRDVLDLEKKLIVWAAAAAESTSGPALAVPPKEAVKLFPSERMARACKGHLDKVANAIGGSKDLVRIAHVTLDGDLEQVRGEESTSGPYDDHAYGHVYVVAYPAPLGRVAFQFWLLTGYGVSSRFSSFWLHNAPFLASRTEKATRSWREALPVEEAREAADAMRSHIASLYSTEDVQATAEDVFLFQCGMAAITQTAGVLRMLANERPDYRIVMFGFLNVDTVAVLSKVLGLGSAFYGHASSAELDALEAELEAGGRIDAVFTEFPTNPQLKLVDLERLHGLAVRHDFVLVVDDSIGTPANVLTAPFCDLVSSSLTKMFSGACNVMGGSIVVSPWSRQRGILRAALGGRYEDTMFPLDVLVLRANSADFEARVAAASANARRVVGQLREHPLVDEVLYPWGGPSQERYERFRKPGAGYGFLLSVRFHRPEAAVAFHDALELAKGPSFGTSFTLVCPYTVLAHYSELEWAGQYGVPAHLVRISIGVEDSELLRAAIGKALNAAELQVGL